MARSVLPRQQVDTAAVQLSVASASGVASCLIVSPAEVMMVTQQATGRTLKQAFLDVVKKSGIKGLFRGNVATGEKKRGADELLQLATSMNNKR